MGFIIEAGKGVLMDPEKVKAIQDWQALLMVKGVRSFLGFANFYWRFVEHFSDVVRLLTELTHTDRAFEWSAEAKQAFRKMKWIFLSEPALL